MEDLLRRVLNTTLANCHSGDQSFDLKCSLPVQVDSYLVDNIAPSPSKPILSNRVDRVTSKFINSYMHEIASYLRIPSELHINVCNGLCRYFHFFHSLP